MKKKFIKFINNERVDVKLLSKKGCTDGAIDYCAQIDAAACTLYAYDRCDKDYAACHKGAHDTCIIDGGNDCSGPGEKDYCTYDYN